MVQSISRNRTQLIVFAFLAVLFLFALQGMSTKDWVVTLLRALSVGAITFLVASGFSIILGLMDVLNLAHGTLFMIGAFVGWTAYVRPDTVIDLTTPLLLLLAGLVLMPLLTPSLTQLSQRPSFGFLGPWFLILLAAGAIFWSLSHMPLAIWDPEVYTDSPIIWTQYFEAGTLADQVQPATASAPPLLVWAILLLGSMALAAGVVGFSLRRGLVTVPGSPRWRVILSFLLMVGAAIGIYVFNDAISNFLLGLNSNWLFLIAIVVATLSGVGLGALMEVTLIRPLYERTLYQIMLTFGLAFIGTEVVRTIWGRTGFTMPRPELFSSTGEGCPATSISTWLQNNCAKIVVEIGGETARIRTYNEIFVTIMGIVVLIAVSILLQRTRLGMIIRAGVQDDEMVEALGINVRRVFTLVFALGVGLAALGGVIAAPAMGLSDAMGANLLLAALIALAIGGLTSYPGAALGSVLVGLLQQFIIKYGQIGINLPFLDEPFKPTPPLVPASTILLMVVILLLMPNGLLGRKE